jgi:hypothetical protein
MMLLSYSLRIVLSNQGKTFASSGTIKMFAIEEILRSFQSSI